MRETLRWVAVLPGAILGGFLATFPLHWILIFWIFPNNGKSFLDFLEFQNRINVSNVELALTPFVIAVFYIWAGAKIAPKYKFLTALVLSAIYACGITYLLFASGLHLGYGLRTGGALLGIFVGLLIVWSEAPKPVQTGSQLGTSGT